MTDFIIGGRASGKTYQLLKMMEEDANCVMVVHTEHEADRLRREHPKMDPRRFVTLRRTPTWWPSREVRFLVDNVDLVLADVLRKLPDTVASTGEVHQISNPGNPHLDSNWPWGDKD